MSIPEIYPPSSRKITLEVRQLSDNALVDPTTLALEICDASETNSTLKAIGDLTHDSTGNYSYIHLFPADSTPGIGYVRATVDAAIQASAQTNITSFRIMEVPAGVSA